MTAAGDNPQLADWVQTQIKDLENYNDPHHDGAAQRWRDALRDYEELHDHTPLIVLLREEREMAQFRLPAAGDITDDGSVHSVQNEIEIIQDLLDLLE